MTKQECMKAFEMRLNGRNWSEIGRELGYTSTAVRDDLLLCVSARPHQVTCGTRRSGTSPTHWSRRMRRWTGKAVRADVG